VGVRGQRHRHASRLTTSSWLFTVGFPPPRDAVAYILDSFPIVRRKDASRYHGDCRTKRRILEINDALPAATASGESHQSRLHPPRPLGMEGIGYLLGAIAAGIRTRLSRR
jgi:hypothetical protein